MITGIILASGLSIRYGKNKLLEDFAGETLLEKILKTIKASNLDQVAVVYHDKQILELIEKFGLNPIYNEEPQKGHSFSIIKGIEGVDPNSDYMFFVADQPDLTTQYINSMIDDYQRDNQKVIISKTDKGYRQPSIFPNKFRDKLLTLNKEKGVTDLITNELNDSFRTYEVESSSLLKDVDEKDDRYRWLLKNGNLVIICGAGEVATAVAERLISSGFFVICLEEENPTMIHRTLSFANAVYEGKTNVEKRLALKCEGYREIYKTLNQKIVPVVVDKDGKLIEKLTPTAVIDATNSMNVDMRLDMALTTISLGYGKIAGVDVDFVVETNLGRNLGRVYSYGTAIEKENEPTEILINSPSSGHLKTDYKISQSINEGDIIGEVGGVPIRAPKSGVITGLSHPNCPIVENQVIASINQNITSKECFEISSVARAIAGGVLEAVMSGVRRDLNFRD